MDPSATHTPLSVAGAHGVVDVVSPAANTASKSSEAEEPHVVILFGWLGAKMATLRKYADAYRRLFPSSAQVVVAADPYRYWKPASLRDRAVLPAVQKLQELGVLSSETHRPPPRILVHALSNGGAMSLADFAAVLQRRNIKAPEGTKCAIIFDSAPAPPTLVLVVRAFTASIRSRFKKYLMAATLSAVYILTFFFRTIARRPEALSVVLKQLNDPQLLPWTSVKTPRMYFYSSGDTIVPARDVEEHAARARMVGFPVEMVNFGKSGHVSHARDYPERYWEAVRTFWADVMKG